jgi:hypothetical protein
MEELKKHKKRQEYLNKFIIIIVFGLFDLG